MGFLSRRRKPRDERIEAIVNRVFRESFLVATVIALTSIAVKWHLHGVDVGLVVSEMLIIGIPSIYYGVRIAFSGVYSDEIELHDRTSEVSMSVKYVASGLVSGLVIAVIFGVRSAVLYGDGGNKVWYFFLVFFASLMIYLPLFVLGVSLFDILARRAGRRSEPDGKE